MERECQVEYTRMEDEKEKLLRSMTQSFSKSPLLKPPGGTAQGRLPDIKTQKSPILNQAKSGNVSKLKSTMSIQSSSSNGSIPKSSSISSSGKAPVEKLPTKIKTVNLNVKSTNK